MYTQGVHKEIPKTSPERLRRFFESINKVRSCWEWAGYINPEEYGQMTIDYTAYKAHRVSYTWLVGEIPEGLHLDHLCLNRKCVNPSHLDPVPAYVNRERQRNRTHCRRGHLYDEGNTYYPPKKNGGRHCRACAKLNQRRYRTLSEIGKG